jgi:hypothetical protein
MAGQAGHVLALKHDGSCGWADVSCQRADDRAFAGAIGAQDRDGLALSDVQVERPNRLDLAIGHRQAADGEQFSHRSAYRNRPRSQPGSR